MEGALSISASLELPFDHFYFHFHTNQVMCGSRATITSGKSEHIPRFQTVCLRAGPTTIVCSG
jgi:hypothetical protein